MLTAQITLAVAGAEGSSTAGCAVVGGDNGSAGVHVPRVAPSLKVMLPTLMRTLLLVAPIVRALLQAKPEPACRKQRQGYRCGM